MSAVRTCAVIAVAVFDLSACGGGGGGSAGDGGSGGAVSGRPGVGDLSAAIRRGDSGLGVSPDDADCVATVLVDSDLSDDALRRYTGDNDADTLSDRDRAAFDDFVEDAKACGVQQSAG